MCTTLSNNATINLPTDACSGTITNLTVNSDLTIPAGIHLTVNGTLTLNSSGSITVYGTLTTTSPCVANGAVVVDGGTWNTTGSQPHMTFNSTLDVIAGATLVCNGNFTNNGVFTIGYNCTIVLQWNATFNASVSSDANSSLTINILSRANTQATLWGGDYHYISGKVVDYNNVTINLTGGLEVDSCKFRTGNFTYSSAANLITTSIGTYIEVNGNASGANAWTTDPTITYYRSGTGGNFGSATAVAQHSPC